MLRPQRSEFGSSCDMFAPDLDSNDPTHGTSAGENCSRPVVPSGRIRDPGLPCGIRKREVLSCRDQWKTGPALPCRYRPPVFAPESHGFLRATRTCTNRAGNPAASIGTGAQHPHGRPRTPGDSAQPRYPAGSAQGILGMDCAVRGAILTGDRTLLGECRQRRPAPGSWFANRARRAGRFRAGRTG